MPDQTAEPVTKVRAGEDAFFVLRDCLDLFQRNLVQIVRQSGVNAPSVIDAFSREIAAAHDELAASARQDGFEQTNGLTASRITLVGNDDLELEIRIGDLINRLKQNERIDRWRVQLRYMTLLDRPKMTAENNPAGLEPISRGIWAICRASGANLDQNLDRLDRIEEQLQAGLPDVYLALNTLLERRGIELAQVRPIQRGAGNVVPGEAGGDAPGRATSSNALSTLQQTLRQQFAGGATSDLVTDGTGNAGGGSGLGNAFLDASALTMLNHLIERLSTLEQRQMSQAGMSAPAPSGAQEPPRAIRAKDVDLPLGKPAAIALDTLSLIFDAIFANPDLSEAVKTIISRLQIPLLKVAILDDTFFSDTQHPARQLINRMAHAAFGLAQDTGRDHPMCVRLAKLADSVRAALDANDANLKPHLDELERLIATRDQSLQLNSQPYMQLVVEHERQLNAKAHANKWLDETLSQCAEPTIRGFLTNYGFRIMQNAAEISGQGGARWQESSKTFEELLWSILPKQTPEERKRLVTMLPSLIKRLTAELDALQVAAEDRTPFLNTCFDLQTAALRNRPDLSARSPTPNPAAPIDEGNAPAHTVQTPSSRVEILERDGKLVQYFAAPAGNPPSWRVAGATAKSGAWITFQLPEEDKLCGRHCGETPDSGSVLLFNSDWGYAVALSRVLLAQQLGSGKARLLSATALFDEAAEQALGQIARR